MSEERFSQEAMRRLIAPRSVAIVGASSTPGALGAAVLANLERSGYQGEIHLINPKRDRIGERACLKSAHDLPAGVDVAVLAIPRPAVLETLRALARREVGAAIVFSAGFAEGGAEGAAEQREIGRIAAESGMVIEGPNCLGLINNVDGVPLTFIETRPAPLNGRRGIAILSQSGAMAAVVGTMLSARDLGISYQISTGNEAASGVEDFLAYLLADSHTQVVGMIVEQFRSPRRFLELTGEGLRANKRIVLLHPGRSSAARAAAATHTGAMAGDYEVMQTLVKHHGVILVEGIEEFGDVLEIAGRCRTLPTGGAAVLAESGAFKALALDLCERVGLDLPELTAENSPAMRAALPPFVPVSNPVDLTAQALIDPELYGRALDALCSDDRFGSVIACIIQGDAAEMKFSRITSALEKNQPRKGVLFAGMDEGANVSPEYIARLRAIGVPWFPTPERALRAVARLSESCAPAGKSADVPIKLAGALLRGVVPEYQAKRLLAGAGIPFPRGKFVASEAEAQAAAMELGFPLVLKAQSKDLSHKSDAGGVALNIRNAEQLAHAWRKMHEDLARHMPGLKLDGVLVEAMAPRGIEMIVGGRNDPDWGPVLLVGFGGVQAEVLQDSCVLPADLDAAGIVRAIDRLRCSRLLHGFRESAPADMDALAAAVQQVGRLLLGEPSIREIDLNPVVVYPRGQGVLALDALLLTS